MLKRVNFGKYQVLREIYNVRIITDNDTEAVIIIQKEKGENKNV